MIDYISNIHRLNAMLNIEFTFPAHKFAAVALAVSVSPVFRIDNNTIELVSKLTGYLPQECHRLVHDLLNIGVIKRASDEAIASVDAHWRGAGYMLDANWSRLGRGTVE